jgi:hypothetical protein
MIPRILYDIAGTLAPDCSGRMTCYLDVGGVNAGRGSPAESGRRHPFPPRCAGRRRCGRETPSYTSRDGAGRPRPSIRTCSTAPHRQRSSAVASSPSDSGRRGAKRVRGVLIEVERERNGADTACSRSQGSGVTSHATKAFSESRFSPSQNVRRLPKCRPSSCVSKQPSVRRNVEPSALPRMWDRSRVRRFCKLGGLPFVGGAFGEMPTYR